jgi:CRP-like cAMP-binding protein
MSENITTKLIPYAFLNKSYQDYIAENSQPKDLASGTTIFKEGSEANHTYFLLKGKVKLSSKNGKESLRGPSALAFSQGYINHALSAETVENCLVLEVFLSPEQQDNLLCWEFTSRYFKEAPWIKSIKNSGMFNYVPSSNLLKLVQSFQVKDAKEGDIITKENNYEREFYVLTEGEANVYQGQIEANSKALTSITALQTFGEAALLEDLPRNATIIMSKAGTLMSFDASKLEDLNSETISTKSFLSRAQLKENANKNEIKLLDIRPEKESALSPLKGAVLAPADQAHRLKEFIDSNTHYVIFSPYEQLNKLVFHLLSEKNPNITILK